MGAAIAAGTRRLRGFRFRGFRFRGFLLAASRLRVPAPTKRRSRFPRCIAAAHGPCGGAGRPVRGGVGTEPNGAGTKRARKLVPGDAHASRRHSDARRRSRPRAALDPDQSGAPRARYRWRTYALARGCGAPFHCPGDGHERPRTADLPTDRRSIARARRSRRAGGHRSAAARSRRGPAADVRAVAAGEHAGILVRRARADDARRTAVGRRRRQPPHDGRPHRTVRACVQRDRHLCRAARRRLSLRRGAAPPAAEARGRRAQSDRLPGFRRRGAARSHLRRAHVAAAVDAQAAARDVLGGGGGRDRAERRAVLRVDGARLRRARLDQPSAARRGAQPERGRTADPRADRRQAGRASVTARPHAARAGPPSRGAAFGAARMLSRSSASSSPSSPSSAASATARRPDTARSPRRGRVRSRARRFARTRPNSARAESRARLPSVPCFARPSRKSTRYCRRSAR
ncbi:hypothetical protein BURPS1710b_A1431 [Burkholderia pseudomallei 1710b]|uniref:Uncharacterized protein n=1 Tax=Burkholderia pseudomallei (strain 1710b) TaxID=320372 RepID=Q3JIL6_BURP1|nr:hypothetical protein BURPS1710b_A1431 [Burkholderia pseudomallei 1710b]